MSKYKICVYSICKNEEQFVDRWMDSIGEADLVVVCDTGSTDNTVEMLRNRGAQVYSICVSPWRFDVARNVSLDFIPDDYDICVCTDLDEVLESGWREKMEKVWTPQTTRLKYMYTWKFNSDGTRGVTYWYEKIHGRHGYRWVNPIHETVKYYGENEIFACDSTIQLNHFPDNSKSRGQYLGLLELSKKENPMDSSTVFWLGREYMFYGQYDKAIETLNEHLALPTATWDQERSASIRYISRCYKAKGDIKKAKAWLYKAIAECAEIREPYMEMARLGYELKDWPLVYHMIEEVLSIKVKQVSYLVEDSSWNSNPYDLGAIACYQLGLYHRAVELAKTAVEMEPDDIRLKNNLKLIQEKVN